VAVPARPLGGFLDSHWRIIMAKIATATIAEQANDFIDTVYTSSVCAKIEKLGEFIGSRTAYVKMLGDEISANGGRYAHHKPGKDATAIDKAQASSMRDRFVTHIEKKLQKGFVKEWSNYRMDKAVFGKLSDDEKKAVDKDRKRVQNAISDAWRDLCERLAFLEGIVLEKAKAKDKSTGNKATQVEPVESGKDETTAIVEAIMTARKRCQKAESVSFNVVGAIVALDAILVDILGAVPDEADDE